MMPKKRGRPRKQRPKRGDPLTAGMSHRDIAAALGISRRHIATALELATIPKAEFDRLVDAAKPASLSQLRKLARIRTGKSAVYERKCPHCGGIIRLEGV
jgi:hypothetical protein